MKGLGFIGALVVLAIGGKYYMEQNTRRTRAIEKLIPEEIKQPRNNKLNYIRELPGEVQRQLNKKNAERSKLIDSYLNED